MLHEMGHLVEQQYGGMNSIRSRDAEGHALLLRTAHHGATHGPSEPFADCYMIYLLTRYGGTRYNHPADPAAYRGTQAERRFEALLSSSAFDYIRH